MHVVLGFRGVSDGVVGCRTRCGGAVGWRRVWRVKNPAPQKMCLLVNGRGTRKGARLDTQRTTSDRDRCEIGAYANRLEQPDGAQTTSPEGQAAEPRVPAATQSRKASAVCKRHDRPSDAWSACRGLRRGERARPGVRGLPQVIVRRVVGLRVAVDAKPVVSVGGAVGGGGGGGVFGGLGGGFGFGIGGGCAVACGGSALATLGGAAGLHGWELWSQEAVVRAEARVGIDGVGGGRQVVGAGEVGADGGCTVLGFYSASAA